MVTDSGLLAIGIEPVVVQTMSAIRDYAKMMAQAIPKLAGSRSGTKQALLIRLLQASGGATIEEIVRATGWQPHTARGAMSGTLGKKLGMVVTSAKEDGRGLVYRISQNASSPNPTAAS